MLRISRSLLPPVFGFGQGEVEVVVREKRAVRGSTPRPRGESVVPIGREGKGTPRSGRDAIRRRRAASRSCGKALVGKVRVREKRAVREAERTCREWLVHNGVMRTSRELS